MDVQEVFRLRREGHIEEAYAAIRPLYAVHHGRYTSLAMFWVGCDIMRLRLYDRRDDEAHNILRALARVYPHLDDKDGTARLNLTRLAWQLKRYKPDFSLLGFLHVFPLAQLPDEAWRIENYAGCTRPSLGHNLSAAIYIELVHGGTLRHAEQAIEQLPAILARFPQEPDTLRFQAAIYTLLEQPDKAQEMLNQLPDKPFPPGTLPWQRQWHSKQ